MRGQRAQDGVRSRGREGDRCTNGKENKIKIRKPEPDDRAEHRSYRISRQGKRAEQRRQRDSRGQASTAQSCPHKAMIKGDVTQAHPALIRPNCMALNK